MSGALGLFRLHRRSDARAELRRNLVLQGEDLSQRAIKAFAENLVTARRVGELDRDADIVSLLADAALQDIADAKFDTDLTQIDGTVFVGEGRRRWRSRTATAGGRAPW